jgi:pimeloyl-ACP methyl ester carboxylesterase
MTEATMTEATTTEPTTIEPITRTLDSLGATITYDIRPDDKGARPFLLLIGSPMGAGGFVTLASHFADRTVVTYDPRGVDRSKKADDLSESTPEQHADDLHRVIEAVGGGPIDLFATSGGAVNALALVAAHPDEVRVLVAHEPPVAGLLPDCASALAASRDVHDTYLRRGFGPAMAKFLKIVSFVGPITPDYHREPDPDPAMFGLPTEDDGSRNDPLLGQNMVSATHYEPDLPALRRATTRIVIAVGAASEGQLAHRGGLAVAERLGLTPVVFPGGHDGFAGGEYGQMGEPHSFAAKLHEVLSPPTGLAES